MSASILISAWQKKDYHLLDVLGQLDKDKDIGKVKDKYKDHTSYLSQVSQAVPVEKKSVM